MTKPELYSTEWVIIAILLRIILFVFGLFVLYLSMDLINVIIFAITGLTYICITFFSHYRGSWIREIECD